MKRINNSVFLLMVVVLMTAAALQAQQVDVLSGTSLRLTIRHDDIEIGTGTGFVVQKGQHYYLITNRHIVLDCAEDKNPNDVGGWLCANKVVILHNRLNHEGEWISVTEKLYRTENDKEKLWLEHPSIGSVPGSSVDLIALPLTQINDVNLLPLNLSLRNTDMRISPGDSVSIVGFPYGNAQGGGLAIWKTGTIASDPDVNFDGKAKFLVDATGRPGMSGSPVYARRFGGYQTAKGQTMLAGNATKFLGVLSEESQAAEIGIVWKAEAVQRLYDSLP
jgi:hypothetical protein